ncbi:unnamed protein product, partial [Onchocerca ochengi]|uniref:CCHC-type domain-containing protein n=1 Tax=Onchocerca ochengi TaxID=42157 RepID=A0A182EUJ4_ONCOC
MSSSLNAAAQPTKENLVRLLEEVETTDLTPDPDLSREQLRQHYELKGRIVKEKTKRLDLYINTLESLDKSWLELIQKTTLPIQRKEEEAKYAKMVEDETGILKLINRGKEAKITLEMYMDDFQRAVQQLSEVKSEEPVTHGETSRTVRATVNLPQLPLPTFSGDPKLWREFWSGFSVAVHFQDIPDIQKLNYLMSCLKGDALLAVRGYDIAPENYDVIRNVLTEKFGQPTTIKKSLYNELQSIKRNDREWKATIEATERVLRQLEATGENLEHSSIEILIENKLPAWILDKVYQSKKERRIWSVQSLRLFLAELVQRNEEVTRSQIPNKERDSAERRPKTPYKFRGETSALAIKKKTEANSSKPTANPKKPNQSKRPCGFCNEDHWDNECRNYPTFKQRMEYLAKIKACLNCLKPGHTTENCNLRKRSCFHCKGPHNTALCCIKYGLQTSESKGQQSNAIVANPITQGINSDEKEVLLLCNEVTVSKPNKPETTERVMAFFDIGAQMSFISKGLADRLKLQRTKEETITIVTF